MVRKITNNIFLVFICGAGFAQNVGIGTSTPTKAGLVVNNKVGGVHALFGDNTSGVSIESNWPGISFNGYFNAGRRTLVTGFTSGVEMNPTTGNFNIYTSPASTVGGNIASVFNRITVKAGGNVGIGVDDPSAVLHVNGGIKVNGNNSIELGAGIAGKQVNAGKIGYALFTSDAVDMLGASVGGSERKIRFWAEGGSTFEGSVNVSSNANIDGFTKLGTNSMGLKTMTLVLPVRKFTGLNGESWATSGSVDIPIAVSNILSHSGHVVYQDPDGTQYSFPLFGHDASAGKFGAGGYRIFRYPNATWTSLNVRFDDCDLCEKYAKFVFHIVYTDQRLPILPTD